MAFWRIEPYPDSWQQTGLLAAIMVNCWGNPKKQALPEDFIPCAKPPRVIDPEDLKRKMQAFAAHRARCK